MGQLRTNIINFHQRCLAFENKITALEKEQEPFDAEVKRHFTDIQLMCTNLLSALKGGLKNRNIAPDAAKALTLSKVLDNTMAGPIQTIGKAKAEIQKLAADAEKFRKDEATKLSVDIQQAFAALSTLKETANKKKGKLLKSKDYKAKIDTYLHAIEEARAGLDKTSHAAKALINLPLKDSELARMFDFKASMTLEQFEAELTKDTKAILNKYQAADRAVEAQIDACQAGFKELEKHLVRIKGWSAEADKMEQEAENFV